MVDSNRFQNYLSGHQGRREERKVTWEILVVQVPLDMARSVMNDIISRRGDLALGMSTIPNRRDTK